MTKPPRAPYGSIETSFLVRMSQDLYDRAETSAARKKTSLAQWWRDAGEAQAKRDEIEEYERRHGKAKK